MNHEIVVELNDVQKKFGSVSILDGIDLEIIRGELVCFIGRSGCGKSTLLKCINGLQKLDGGKITVAGKSLTPQSSEMDAQALRRNCGMVFQDFRLFPHLSLIENVMLAPRINKKISEDQAWDEAENLLEKVGLTAHKEKKPYLLSGGQQQRGAIARALALSPQVMLYDEPTSALDPELRDEVLQVMKRLDAEGMTQLVVTHEMRFAKDASDWIVYMESGKIIEKTAPDRLFSQPQDERTKLFLRKVL